MSSLNKIIALLMIMTTIGAILLTLFTFISFVFVFAFAVFGAVIAFSAIAYVLDSLGLIKVDNKNKKINIGKEKMTQEDKIERLKQKFVNGEISEDELERRLDSEFGKTKNVSKEFNRMI